MKFCGEKMSNVAFYFLLLIGSVAFGFEALLVGFGGRLIPLYRQRPWLTLGMASGLGLWVVGISIVIGLALVLEPLYVGGIVVVLTIVAGKIISFVKPELVKTSTLKVKRISDAEIKQDLKKRGMGKLTRKKKK